MAEELVTEAEREGGRRRGEVNEAVREVEEAVKAFEEASQLTAQALEVGVAYRASLSSGLWPVGTGCSEGEGRSDKHSI